MSDQAVFHNETSILYERCLGLSEQVPGVFQVVFRLGYAATRSGTGWLK